MVVGFKRTKHEADFSKWYFEDDFDKFNDQIKAILDTILAKRFEVDFGDNGDPATTLSLDLEPNKEGLQVGCRIYFDDMGCFAFAKASLRELIQSEIQFGETEAVTVAKELRTIAAELEK